jgi:hypothetical protein
MEAKSFFDVGVAKGHANYKKNNNKKKNSTIVLHMVCSILLDLC